MPDSGTGTRRALERWGQVAGLWTLAVCLPVLQVLADSPDYLVAEHAGFPDLPLTVIGYVLVPPTVGAAVIWLAGRLDSRVGDWLQAGAVGALVGVFALQVLKEQIEPTSRSSTSERCVVAVAVMVAYMRTRFPSAMATVLAPAVLLVPLWFLLLSPVGPVARGESGPNVESPAANGTPVVLVVFDEFSGVSLLTPEGRMDSERFPNLAHFDATWFRNATAAADTTIQAVPAIVSGQVKWGELPVAKDYPRNLFSLLDRSYGCTRTSRSQTSVTAVRTKGGARAGGSAARVELATHRAAAEARGPAERSRCSVLVDPESRRCVA